MRKSWTQEEINFILVLKKRGNTNEYIAHILGRTKRDIANLPYSGTKDMEDSEKKDILFRKPSICINCEKTNMIDCTWFDPDNQVIPDGCTYDKYICADGVRYNITQCPNFKKEVRKCKATKINEDI